jgi:hypothetical protein
MLVMRAVIFKERAMKREYLIFGGVLAGAIIVQPLARSEEVDGKESAAPPEQGYRMVQKVEYKEIEHRYCKMVPVKRRKWVYCTKPDYYCHPPCPIHWPWHHKDDCDCQACRDCRGPFYRPQLMKKEIEWECGKTCQIEVVKEKVPVLVWRKEAISPKKEDSKAAPTPANGKQERLPPPRPVTPGSTEEAERGLLVPGQQGP